jgi:hypothetical protein
VSYEVPAVGLNRLREHVGVDRVDFLKLDLEGAEYELLDTVSSEDLAPFAQIFVEFHHHAVAAITIRDTERVVARVCQMGFNAHSLDDHNYLFSKAG